MTATATSPKLIDDAGETLRLNFHAGQLRAWDSTARVLLVLAGTRSGKTSFGPWWLWREMQRQGPGNYLVAAPSFTLADKAAGPEIEAVFHDTLRLGRMYRSPTWQFVFDAAGTERTFGTALAPRTRIIFGHADAPDSLEGFAAKAAWLDECGQRLFKLGSWQAIQRRLTIDGGRTLMTTTPYYQGWLKTEVYDRWKAGDADYDVVQFDSRMNPRFPVSEWDRARRTLPGWKFNLFYRAQFDRPAGLIYDCFDTGSHTCPRFTVPESWPRHLGLDFGGVNTAGIFLAEEPNTRPRRYYAYREYHAGGRTAKEHAVELRKGEPRLPGCVGGSKSEGQWRAEFRQAGLPVREPLITDVEVGIDRVYGAIKEGCLIVFDDLAGLLDELATYSRPTDEAGNPLSGIADKEQYHRLDAIRYIVGWLRRGGPTGAFETPAGRGVMETAPAGVFNG